MARILLWIGIALIVIGMIALGWVGAKGMAVKDELEKFPEKRNAMLLRRNYCRLTMIVGILFILISILI